MWAVRVVQKFAAYVHDESGSTAIEYGLIAGLLGIAIIVSLKGIRTQLVAWMVVVTAELTAANN